MFSLFLWWPIAAAVLRPPTYSSELPDYILAIAGRYFGPECLSFLFPMNLSSPSAVYVPDLVRSDLLRRVHERWSPYLPSAYVNKNLNLTNTTFEPGVFLYLKCNYIIVLDAEEDFIVQLSRVLPSVYPVLNFYAYGGRSDTRMVVAVDGEVSESNIYRVLNHIYVNGDLNAVFVTSRDNIFSIHTLFPFGKDGKACPEKNLGVLALEKLSVTKDELFPKKIPAIFNNCTINASAAHNPPFFAIDKKDGIVRSIDGIDYRLIKTVTDRLNVNVEFITYKSATEWEFTDQNGTVQGSIKDVATGRAWYMLSGGGNKPEIFPSMRIVHVTIMTKWLWYFRQPDLVPSWRLIYLAFNLDLWVFVVIVIMTAPLVFFGLERLSKGRKSWKRFSNCFLDLLRTTCAGSARATPSSKVMRSLFALWLIYALHINNAYIASLTGLITGGMYEPKITTFEQLYDSKLPTAASNYMLTSINMTIDPLLNKIVSRYVLREGYDPHINDMIVHKNMTILGADIVVDYICKKKKFNLYKSELSYSIFPTGPIMKRNHFMFEKTSAIANRIIEGGIVDKWIDDFTLKNWKDPKDDSFKAVSFEDMYGPIFIFLFGNLAATIVFIFEVIIGKYFA